MRKGLGHRLESMPHLRQENLVAFQGKADPFVEAYDAILERIRQKRKDGWYDFEISRDEDAKAIQKLINDRFKMNIHLVTDGGEAAVIPFFATDNNVLMREVFRQGGWLESEKAFMKSADQLNGMVDLENATLGGDFSKGKSTLYMNYNTLMEGRNVGGRQLTNREIIAVTSHEIGHIFYPLAYAMRVDKGNVFLEQAQRELRKDNPDKIKIVHNAISRMTKTDAPKIAADLCSENPTIVTKAALALIGEQTLQHQADAKYTNTNFEALADNFAARLGLSKELVTALEKLTPGGARYGDMVRAIMETSVIIRQIFKIVSLIKVIVGDKTPLAKAILTTIWIFTKGITMAVFFYVMIRLSGEAGRDYTYDDLVKRYGRIRAQLIAEVKGRQLTKADATRVIDQIEFIGNLIKEGQNWRTPLDFIFNTFNPDDRRAKDSIGRQQALESLINNELFVSSLKLTKAAG